MNDVDIKYLNYILTIAKKENITKAAEELYISQSSLSQYLAKLEQDIGVPLFIRAKGKLTLTKAGELYVKAAEQVISIQKNLYYQMRSSNNKSHITIGVTSIFGLQMLTKLIPKYKEVYPDVTIEITEANIPTLAGMIQEETIDCAVIAMNDINYFEKDQILPLGREELFFAVPTALAYRNEAEAISWAEIVEKFSLENFILSKKNSSIRALTDRIFSEMNFIPSTMCETNNIRTVRSMVEMGIGVAFINESCTEKNENICYYSLQPRLFRNLAFVYRKGWILNEPEKNLKDRITQYFLEEDMAWARK